MKSAVFTVVLCIVFFSTVGWSETKFFKIPAPEEKSDKGQVTPSETPAEPKADPKSKAKFFKVPTPEKKPDKEQVTPQETPATPKTDTKKEKQKKSRPAEPKPKATSTSTGKKKKADTKKHRPQKRQTDALSIVTLQVASFRDLKAAQDEALRLKTHAVSTIIRRETIRDKGDWYLVYAGRFKSKRDALGYDQELKKEGIISWSWVKRIRLTPEEVAQQSPRRKARTARIKKKPVDKKATKSVKRPPKTTQPKKRTTQPTPAQRVEKPAPKSVKKPKKTTPPSKARTPSVSKKTVPSVKKQPRKESRSTAKSKEKGKAASRLGRLSVGIRLSALLASSASDFRITKTEGSDTEHYEFENNKALAGLTANWRFSDRWSLDVAIEQVIMAKLDMQNFSIGSKMHFAKPGLVRPYLRAALVYGDLAWDEAPGAFDSALGADLGIGIDFNGWHFSAGLEAAYRYMTFDYNRPSGTDVTATDSQLDFSGFTLSGIVRYRF